MVNGSPVGMLRPSKGLRQGDPLSPYLFILAIEDPSRMLKLAESEGRISGIKVNKNAPPISHLMFADVTLVFVKSSLQDISTLQEILNKYEFFSGHRVNFDKSVILLSPHLSPITRNFIRDVLPIPHMHNGTKYLGIPMFWSPNNTKRFDFLLGKISKRIEHWNSRFLSQAGRTCLIRSVTNTIANYAVNCFLLPKNVVNSINRMQSKFWWGKSSEKF